MNALDICTRGLLGGYFMLHEGLTDMLENERLIEADIPDDHVWLLEMLKRIEAMERLYNQVVWADPEAAQEENVLIKKLLSIAETYNLEEIT